MQNILSSMTQARVLSQVKLFLHLNKYAIASFHTCAFYVILHSIEKTIIKKMLTHIKVITVNYEYPHVYTLSQCAVQCYNSASVSRTMCPSSSTRVSDS